MPAQRDHLPLPTAAFVGHLRTADAGTIVGFDVEQLPKHVRPMVQELQSAESRSRPEAEQHKDIWDMTVFGHGRKRMDFTVIAQPWLRNAANVLVPIGTFNEGQNVTLWAGVSPANFPTMTITEEAADGDQGSSGQRVLVGTAVEQ